MKLLRILAFIFLLCAVIFFIITQLVKVNNAPQFVKRICFTDSQCVLIDDCCGRSFQSFNIYTTNLDSHYSYCRQVLQSEALKCPLGILNPIPAGAKCQLFQCKVYNFVSKKFWSD